MIFRLCYKHNFRIPLHKAILAAIVTVLSVSVIRYRKATWYDHIRMPIRVVFQNSTLSDARVMPLTSYLNFALLLKAIIYTYSLCGTRSIVREYGIKPAEQALAVGLYLPGKYRLVCPFVRSIYFLLGNQLVCGISTTLALDYIFPCASYWMSETYLLFMPIYILFRSL